MPAGRTSLLLTPQKKKSQVKSSQTKTQSNQISMFLHSHPFQPPQPTQSASGITRPSPFSSTPEAEKYHAHPLKTQLLNIQKPRQPRLSPSPSDSSQPYASRQSAEVARPLRGPSLLLLAQRSPLPYDAPTGPHTRATHARPTPKLPHRHSTSSSRPRPHAERPRPSPAAPAPPGGGAAAAAAAAAGPLPREKKRTYHRSHRRRRRRRLCHCRRS